MSLDQMKTYKAKVLENGSVGLTCPRTDCKGKFVVNPHKVMAFRVQAAENTRVGLYLKTASCPYCWRVNKLPQEVLDVDAES